MTPPVIFPRLAQLAAGRRNPTLLARGRRGQVLHLVDAGACHNGCSSTPTGQLRTPPLCGQRVRRLHVVEYPARRLCAWCAAVAGRDCRLEDWQRLDVGDIVWALELCRDLHDVDEVARALHEQPHLRQRKVPTRTGRRVPLIAIVHRSPTWTRHAA